MNSICYISDMRIAIKDERFHSIADLIFADPPYNIGQDYGRTYNDKKSITCFRDWLYEVVWACACILKPTGSIFFMMGEKHTDDVGHLLRQRGFVRRRLLVWHESFGVYQTRNFADCCRYIHYCVVDPKHFTFNANSILIPSARQIKYGDKRAAASGRIPDNLCADSRVCGTFHERVKSSVPNQLPESLVSRIIKLASNPNDVVCDPFTGTGTTAAVCSKLDRNFVGFEINPKHARVAQKRVHPLVTHSLT